MTRQRYLRIALVTLPPTAIAVVGLAHPAGLTPASADRWVDVHVALLPLLPLLGLAPWLVLRHVVRRPVAWLAAALGYVFAFCYTSLDVLAGIGAGTLQQRNNGVGREFMFARGNEIAEFGGYAYLLAAVIAAIVMVTRARFRLLPAVLLVVGGAWSFMDSHVYYPRGFLTLLALAVGWGLLAYAVNESKPSPSVENDPVAPGEK